MPPDALPVLQPQPSNGLLLVGLALDLREVRPAVWDQIGSWCEAGLVSRVDIVTAEEADELASRGLFGRTPALAGCDFDVTMQDGDVSALPRLPRLAQLRARQQRRLRKSGIIPACEAAVLGSPGL